MGSLQYWVSVHIALQRKENPIELRILITRTHAFSLSVPAPAGKTSWSGTKGTVPVPLKRRDLASGSGWVELVPRATGCSSGCRGAHGPVGGSGFKREMRQCTQSAEFSPRPVAHTQSVVYCHVCAWVCRSGRCPRAKSPHWLSLTGGFPKSICMIYLFTYFMLISSSVNYEWSSLCASPLGEANDVKNVEEPRGAGRPGRAPRELLLLFL